MLFAYVECASREEVKTVVYITKAEMKNIVMQDRALERAGKILITAREVSRWT